jgi:hypothetical protein
MTESRETPVAVRITGGSRGNIFYDCHISGFRVAFDLDGAGPDNKIIKTTVVGPEEQEAASRSKRKRRARRS